MDYKTTILSKPLEVEEELLPGIYGLKFGDLGQGHTLFDYTAYFEENELEPIDYKKFMRINKHFIEAIAESSSIPTTHLFYQNTDGHILVSSVLAFLFLSYVNNDLLKYFNRLLLDALVDGVAYSSMYIMELASRQLSNDALKDIIEDRNVGNN